MNDHAPDRLETAEEIAKWLNVPVSWVREQARRDALPVVRLGRYVRFERAAVAAKLGLQGTSSDTTSTRS
jgi:excisionase family DNA binding protein